jgi:hypothetical protein
VSVTQNTDELDDAERDKLLKDTVLIKDKRDSQGTSIAYNTQIRQEMTNPSETGLYEMLERPGTFDRMLIITNPVSISGQKNVCTVVRLDGSSKSWVNAHRSVLWARKQEDKKDFDKWFEGLGDKDSLTKGGLYVAVGPNGGGTVPFEVRENYGDGAYKVDFKDFCDYSNDRVTKTTACCDPYDDYVSPYGAKLVVNAEGKQGTKLRVLRGELRIPGEFKFLKLQDPPKPSSDYPIDSCESGSEKKPIQPGKIEDIQM